MKRFIAVVAVFVLAGFNTSVIAEDKAEKIEGTVTCAKCDLKKTDSCQTVIVAKKDGKEVTYYFDKDSSKKFHGKVCTAPKPGTVTGTVTKDGDMMTIKVTEVEFK